MDIERRIIFYGHYFQDFFLDQDAKVREKIGYVFKIIKTVQKIPEKFFKSIEGAEGLFEIRIEFESNIYRVFCCFDKGNLVVLFNAFQKKTKKTPSQEIELAIKLKNEYINSKNKNHE